MAPTFPTRVGPAAFPVAIFIVRELLSGLGYLHEPRDQRRRGDPGLVHRDVTPRNVLLSWEDAVKLADFGLAQMLERSATVGMNARAGTPGYMSPEQARGEDLDGRSDLYAIGIVLWEFLTSQRLRAEVHARCDVTLGPSVEDFRIPTVPEDAASFSRASRERVVTQSAGGMGCTSALAL